MTCLFHRVKTANTGYRPAWLQWIIVNVMKHYGNYSAHTAGIFFFFPHIALGCMVSLLHLNRKPVLWCGCKLDTVLEFAPLLCEGQTLCVWQLLWWCCSNLQWMSKVVLNKVRQLYLNHNTRCGLGEDNGRILHICTEKLCPNHKIILKG